MPPEVLDTWVFTPSTDNRSSYFGKTLFDYLCALILTPVALLVMAIAGIAIWWSGESPFFLQRRVGQGMKTFWIIKLRTMRDGKITRIGAFLRTYWLDELPQVLHIWSRQMSFVGPRPYQYDEFTYWVSQYERYTLRQEAKPGLVSRAALMGKAREVAKRYGNHVPLTLDLYYVMNQSVWHDLALVWLAIRTFFGFDPTPKALPPG